MERDLIGQRIAAAMQSASERQATWGVDDCALWAANILAPVLGFDPMAEFRGKYRSKRGALRLLGRRGLERMLSSRAEHWGWRAIDPRRAAVGDVGLIKINGVPSIVLRYRAGWFVGRGEHGYAAVATDNALLKRCWEIK